MKRMFNVLTSGLRWLILKEKWVNVDKGGEKWVASKIKPLLETNRNWTNIDVYWGIHN